MIKEWVGPAIMTAVAVGGLPAYMWVIFRIAHGGDGWPRRRSRP